MPKKRPSATNYRPRIEQLEDRSSPTSLLGAALGGDGLVDTFDQVNTGGGRGLSRSVDIP